MPRRPPVALLAALLAAACSSPLPAVPVTPVAGASPACAALVKRLPHALTKGVSARRVTPAATSTAAWGTDPAITLRCGVRRGNPLDDPYEFDGVRWVVHDDGATNRWTTLDRKAPVEVVVPDRYDSQAELLISLSPALRKS